MFKITKISMLFCLSVLSLQMMAQSQSTPFLKKGKPVTPRPENLVAVPSPKKLTGLEVPTVAPVSVPPAAASLRGVADEFVGQTYYDLQSNGTCNARVHVWDNGEVSMSWTTSSDNENMGWSLRGSGYNRRSNWLAGNTTIERLETAARTGFSNYVVTASGVELIFSHKAWAGSVYRTHMLRREPGQTYWEESTVPSNLPKGALWCKAAADGETVYVIALTTPVSLSGEIYKGMDGHVLLWRSPDAGKTWDIVDGVIPGFDESAFYFVSAEEYQIDARDGIVAVAAMSSWNDLKVFKSKDRGNTWEAPLLVLDFPLDKYQIDKGYTVDDIGNSNQGGPSTEPLAIFTNDGAGTILIDNDGLVHVWFGRMYVVDNDLTDGNTSYYPGYNGLYYWNENRQADDFSLAGDIIDFNGNDTIDNFGITGIAYGCNLSSMATAAVDDLGFIYLAYSALNDALVNDQGLSYRHIVTTASFDNGESWAPAVDIHYTFPDPTLADFQEGVYPSAYKRVGSDGKFHFQFELDYRPGSGVLEAGPQNDPAAIVYIGWNQLSSVKDQNSVIKNIQVAPNPTADRSRLMFQSDIAGDATVQIFNALGSLESTRNFSVFQGANVLELDATTLATGLHFVRLSVGNQTVSTKLMVNKN